jgi:hypothetical protein
VGLVVGFILWPTVVVGISVAALVLKAVSGASTWSHTLRQGDLLLVGIGLTASAKLSNTMLPSEGLNLREGARQPRTAAATETRHRLVHILCGDLSISLQGDRPTAILDLRDKRPAKILIALRRVDHTRNHKSIIHARRR